MKFNSANKVVDKKDLFDLTAEDIIIMQEASKQAHKSALEDIEDPFNSFVTIASMAAKDGVAKAIENLNDTESTELCEVFGVDKAGLESMSLETFLDKCDDCLGIEPATESTMSEVLMLWLGYILGSSHAGKSTEKVADKEFVGSFKNILDAIPSDKRSDALKAFTVVTWKYETYKSMIKGANEAFDYCQQTADKIFTSDSLVELEKIAHALNTHADPIVYKDNDQLKAWATWAHQENPRETASTLAELGFTVEKLSEIVGALHEFANRYISLSQKLSKDVKAHTKRGFFEAIGEFFSKKKREEGARLREIANTKYHAMKYIMGYVNDVVNAMCSDIVIIGNKAKRLAKSDQQ